MREIGELIRGVRPEARTAQGTLTHRLERVAEGYLVRGERLSAPMPWLTVFFDPAFQYIDYNSTVELTDENVSACVFRPLNLAFVRADLLERFARDAAGFGLGMIPLESLEAPELCCGNPEALPPSLREAPWGRGLDAGGFSVLELAESMNRAGKRA